MSSTYSVCARCGTMFEAPSGGPEADLCRGCQPARDEEDARQDAAERDLADFDTRAARAARRHVIHGLNGPQLRTPTQGFLRGGLPLAGGLLGIGLPLFLMLQGAPGMPPFGPERLFMLVPGGIMLAIGLAWGLLGRSWALKSLRWCAALQAERNALRARHGLPPQTCSIQQILAGPARPVVPVREARRAERQVRRPVTAEEATPAAGTAQLLTDLDLAWARRQSSGIPLALGLALWHARGVALPAFPLLLGAAWWFGLADVWSLLLMLMLGLWVGGMMALFARQHQTDEAAYQAYRADLLARLRAEQPTAADLLSERSILDAKWAGHGAPPERGRGTFPLLAYGLPGLLLLGLAVYVLGVRGGWDHHLEQQRALWKVVGDAGQMAIVLVFPVLAISLFYSLLVAVFAAAGPILVAVGVLTWLARELPAILYAGLYAGARARYEKQRSDLTARLAALPGLPSGPRDA